MIEIQEILCMLLFLASPRVTPCISLICGTVSSRDVNNFEQNLHFQLPHISEDFLFNTIELIARFSLSFVTSSGDWRMSWWSWYTWPTASFSRENTLLQSRHCLAFPIVFRRLFFTWTFVITGLSCRDPELLLLIPRR